LFFLTLSLPSIAAYRIIGNSSVFENTHLGRLTIFVNGIDPFDL